jgi:hypothetical protein
MEEDKAKTLLEEFRLRAIKALAQVNAGVAETLELLHEEDTGLDEAFGAPSRDERAQLEEDKREVARLEAASRAEPQAQHKRRDPMWTWRKRGGR